MNDLIVLKIFKRNIWITHVFVLNLIKSQMDKLKKSGASIIGELIEKGWASLYANHGMLLGGGLFRCKCVIMRFV